MQYQKRYYVFRIEDEENSNCQEVVAPRENTNTYMQPMQHLDLHMLVRMTAFTKWRVARVSTLECWPASAAALEGVGG